MKILAVILFLITFFITDNVGGGIAAIGLCLIWLVILAISIGGQLSEIIIKMK